MSLADYLAKNYLNADTPSDKKSKKRKRKAAGGLVIADDDSLGWPSASSKKDDEDGPAIVSGHSGEFRKARKSAWTVVGVPAPKDADQAAADAIIASAVEESRAIHDSANADELPVIEGGTAGDDDDQDGPRMESGALAGLQTADQVTAAMKKRLASERARFAAETKANGAGQSQETIYRDASGRIINIAMKRAEARRAAEDAAAKLKQEEEAAKGDVQRAAAAAHKQQLQEAKYMPVARYADDTTLNDELRAQERWNDPAAAFIAKKKAGKSVTGKPLYKGAAPPNRYGIRPGHRWDGVDRGNGFEKQWFDSRNRKQNVKNLEYAWQMDE